MIVYLTFTKNVECTGAYEHIGADSRKNADLKNNSINPPVQPRQPPMKNMPYENLETMYDLRGTGTC